jgi:WD40 repeat protein
MERNKIIFAVAVLGVGAVMWRGSVAMEQEQRNVAFKTSDGQIVSVAQDKAQLFGTVKALLIDAPQEDEVIPLSDVNYAVLEQLIDDLSWVELVQKQKLPFESEQQAAARIMKMMMTIDDFDLDELQLYVSALRAADYLQQPILVERYKKKVLDILKTEDLMRSLIKNDIACIKILQEIGKLPADILRDITDSIREEYWVEGLTFKGHTAGINSALFSRDERSIVTASRDNTGRTWNVGTGKQIWILPYDPSSIDWVEAAEFSPGGTMVVTTNSDGITKIWNAYSGKIIRSFEGLKMLPGTGSKRAAAFCSNDKVVAAGENGTVKIWDIETGQVLNTLKSDNPPSNPWDSADIEILRVSPDDSKIMTIWPNDKRVMIWDANTGRQLSIANFNTDNKLRLFQARFASDGKKIVMIARQDLNYAHNFDIHAIIWNVETAQTIRRLLLETQETTDGRRPGVIAEAKLSLDGSKLVTVCWDNIKVWNMSTGDLLLEIPSLGRNNSMVQSVAFSPDGNRLAVGSRDYTVKIWDIGKQVLQHVLTGHTDDVWSVVYSADGDKVLTASLDHTAKIFVRLPDFLPGISDFDTCLFERLLMWARANNQKISKTGWAGDILRRIAWRDIQAVPKRGLQKLIHETMQHANVE